MFNAFIFSLSIIFEALNAPICIIFVSKSPKYLHEHAPPNENIRPGKKVNKESQHKRSGKYDSKLAAVTEVI